MKNNKFILAVAVFSMFFLASCAAVFEDVETTDTAVTGSTTEVSGSTTEPVGTTTLPAGTTTNATTTTANAEGTTSAIGSSSTPVENAPALGNTSTQQ